MSQKQNPSRTPSVRALLQLLIELVLPLGLLSAKLFSLNTGMLKLGSYTLPMLCASLVTVGVLCLLIRLVFRRDHFPFFMVLYGILSVFMLIDAVYCAYTGKLPSAVMLQYLGQLDGVSDAIYANVTFARLLYAIDIPLWILYAVHFRRRWFGGIAPRHWNLQKNVILSAVTALSLVICVGYCLFTPFVPSYFKSEILAYHVTDILSQILPGSGITSSVPVWSEQNPGGDDAEEDPYRGIAEGRNVITIQVEALQNFVLNLEYNGQVITPNLNALLTQDTLYFDNYYYQIGGGNTADAEFAVNNSLYAPVDEAAYSRYADNDFYSMAKLLKDNGFTSATAFHGYVNTFWNRNVAYPGQGFDA